MLQLGRGGSGLVVTLLVYAVSAVMVRAVLNPEPDAR